MNPWNALENQLRSWTPRSPSARLKAEIFQKNTAPERETVSAFAGRFSWIAPAMACSFTLMVLSGIHNGPLTSLAAGRNTNLLGLATSNQSYAAFLVADFHSEQNALQRGPIEWTGNPVNPSASPVQYISTTNSLNR